MLKTKVSECWQGLEPRSLMMLALDVVESLYGLAVRHKAEGDLLALERELAEVLAGQDAAEQLLPTLFGPLGLAGDWERFFSTDNCLLDRVLARRRGIPVTLGILILHLCERVGVRAEGICFPGHFLLRLWSGEEEAIIDPFTGRELSKREIEQLLRGARGNLARLKPEQLKGADNQAILERLLNVTKAAFIHHKQFSQALACSQLLLKLKPDCPVERRDRGFLFEQLDCHRLAAEDFEFFIQHCPEDPVADVLKAQIAALDLGPKTLH
ncbi:SirB1 family protein [Zobellella iuensis]|uniref:Tetratricopeptide repeat protein n=1 Tax=Zobellella iuensis TaxID=2803811 RepID=A0ABS1QVZ8_9GAMM|nr:tetratricopeptide repeat protein [Zobellella iuensis]MBL1378722.1 tetratricopeptide repeat protein [Zobellella iuensis]